jgi:hypothetical protein
MLTPAMKNTKPNVEAALAICKPYFHVTEWRTTLYAAHHRQPRAFARFLVS